MGMGMQEILPSVLQAGVGAGDAMMGMASQVANMIKNWKVGEAMAGEGQKQSDRFTDQVLNPATQDTADYAKNIQDAIGVMNTVPGQILGAKKNYAGITEQATAQHGESKKAIAQSQATARAELAKREQEFKDEQSFRDTTMATGRARFGSMAADIRKDYSANAIGVNASVRASSAKSIESQVRDWKTQGLDADTIKRRVKAIQEGTDIAIIQNTGKAYIDAVDKSTQVGVAGEQNLVNTLSVTSSSLTGARSAMSQAADRTVTTDTTAAALTEQANEFLTGTQINVAGAVTNLDIGAANATASIANMQLAGSQAVMQQRNLLNTLRTAATEYIFNPIMAGLGVIADKTNLNFGVGTSASFSTAMAPAFSNLASVQVASMQPSQSSGGGGLLGSLGGAAIGAGGALGGAAIAGNAEVASALILAAGPSDRNIKHDIKLPDADHINRIVKAVDDLPVYLWKYNGDRNEVEHVGPMAQDFQSVIPTDNDRVVNLVDANGALMIVVKTLLRRVETLETKIASIEAPQQLQSSR